MTEATATVTDLLNQPLTPDIARQRIGERLANPEFRDRYLKNDQVAAAEMRSLHEALFPAPSVQSAEEVSKQMDAREVAFTDQRIAGLLKIADLSPAMQDEIRRQQPIAADEQKFAREEIARLKRDKGFTRKLFDGDREANTAWTRLHQIVSLPTASTKTTYPVK
jgi:hypothetical protein